MEPFKNVFSPALIKCYAHHLNKHLDGFDDAAFQRDILGELENLELKARVQLIADTLHAVLPGDPGERSAVLMAMLHPDEMSEGDAQSNDDGICGWGIQPLTELAGQYGQGDFEGSLELLREMTRRFTSEFGIRHLIIADQERALEIISGWIDDPSKHVRRLVSEGTRPRLPWGLQLKQLVADPMPTMPMLLALRDDPEEYVRRSVANHLNDIAKDHPNLVATRATEWMKNADKNREKLVRHACRTLIKNGHPDALRAIGLNPPQLGLDSLTIENTTVNYGEGVSFSAKLKSLSDQPQQLVIDYLIHFKKASGALAPKVFKGSKLTLQAHDTVVFERTHKIKPITTRRYYPGEHGVSLRINGQDFGYERFDLLIS